VSAAVAAKEPPAATTNMLAKAILESFIFSPKRRLGNTKTLVCGCHQKPSFNLKLPMPQKI